MKKYKWLVIIVIILGIYGLVLYFAFGNKKDNESNNSSSSNNSSEVKKEDKYLVLDNISNIHYNNIDYSNAKIKRIEELDKLKVYVNNNYYGDYKLKNAGNWNLFDKNDEFVNYNGSLIAFSENFNIKVRNNYKIREINEKDKVLLMNKYNLSTFEYLTTNEVIDYDLDNNGVMDEIICLSSIEESNNPKNYYNVVMLKLNDEVIPLIEERENNAKYVYSIFSILNIENNKYDSIILTKTEGYISENPKVSSIIYNYKNDKYVIDYI